MGAKINNPRKEFQFTVIIPGLNPFLCQKAKLPDIDFDITEHGDTNFLVKTAGIKKIGKFSLDKISPADATDEFIYDWMDQIQDTTSGGGQLPSQYKQHILVEQYSNDGITVLKTWELSGAFPCKLNGIAFDRKSSENTVEAIEFDCDEVL